MTDRVSDSRMCFQCFRVGVCFLCFGIETSKLILRTDMISVDDYPARYHRITLVMIKYTRLGTGALCTARVQVYWYLQYACAGL